LRRNNGVEDVDMGNEWVRRRDVSYKAASESDMIRIG